MTCGRWTRATAELRRRFDDLILSRRAAPEQGDDLLSLLLTVTDPETGEGLSHEDVRDQAGVMLLAGYDTTSTAMTFALHLLGHPEWQDAVRDEVRSVLDGRPATTHDAPALALTRRVVDEALRLHPSAYITSRSATADTRSAGKPSRGAGSWRPRSTRCTATRTCGRTGPLDPDRFLPESVKARAPYAYLPFGGGPRSCIGNHFALLEATLGVATVVANARLESRTDHAPVVLGITQRPAAPVMAAVSAA